MIITLLRMADGISDIDHCGGRVWRNPSIPDKKCKHFGRKLRTAES